MEHIFISYSRRDEEQVTRFAENLRRLGFEVWQDISGKRSGIPYSVKWFEVIEEAVFTAAGAIIFKSDAWSRSKPCQEEFRMIRETALPFVCLEAEALLSDEASVFGEVTRWCRAQIVSGENSYRSWMLSGAYRLYKGLPMAAYFPTGKYYIRNWLWLKTCKRIAAQAGFHGSWTKSLDLFLRKAQHKLWGDIAVRALAGIFVLAVIHWVPAFQEAWGMAKSFNEMLSSTSAFTSIMQRVGEYDPVLSVRMAEAFEAAGEKDQDNMLSSSTFWYWLYTGQTRILPEFLSRNYPIAFYESAAECSVVLSDTGRTQTNSRYTVSLSNDTAQVFLYDHELDTTRQLLLAAVPEIYCFNDAGDKLLLAAENKVYIYDLLGEAPPSLLSYNFENVSELYCDEDKIYAVTENGHVVVWNDPLQERKIHRENITTGVLSQTGEGSVMAVYVDNGCLIRNSGNNEEIYLLPFGDEVDSDYIAVSSDCAYAAVSYRPEGSDTDWIGLVDLMEGTVRRTYDTEHNIREYVFSADDASLLITCADERKIARINLETGVIQESELNKDMYFNPYSIITYKDKILICDTLGDLTIYNDALKQVGDCRIIGSGVPQKQLAVSQKYDCLLTARRGGNALNVFQKILLSSDEKINFVPVYGEAMISTTSVAVTDTGEYAAYGNAGGAVYIWDVGSMEQVWNVHCIPEAVVNMLFSDDYRALYVLGSSGTIYKVDISAIALECMPENPESIWRMQMHMAEEIAQNMYRLGLAAEQAAF